MCISLFISVTVQCHYYHSCTEEERVYNMLFIDKKVQSRADLDINTATRWRLLCLYKNISVVILNSIVVIYLHGLPLWIRACTVSTLPFLQRGGDSSFPNKGMARYYCRNSRFAHAVFVFFIM